MRIYYHLDDFRPLPFAVVTSGTFDGVHLGHQKILNRLKEVASRHRGETVVLTYWPHPRLVLYPDDQSLRLLNTFEEKAELLKAQGIHHLVRIPFTREFSQISSVRFITEILVDNLGTKKLVIGYDHRFGKNREGSFSELQTNGPQYGFDVEEIPAQDVDHVTISSSKIRVALQTGDVGTARQFLGRNYAITGRVIKGDQLGRVLGFPTANLDLDAHHKLVPAEGIYAVHVHHARQAFQGMLYIGNRPTINGTRPVIEVNIFNFNREIYGENLVVEFVQLLRKDARFATLDELKSQLEKDRMSALQVFDNQ
ncbi:MAG: bifunctional riboflavin kinase/FAD synthetase [Cyclobacteriaceae bacterium]|jgi:riboflavin kinase/FMN adenylyltransferase